MRSRFELLTAPKYDLRRINIARETAKLPQVSEAEMEYKLPEPSSTLVFNDGSTGIYRQVVEFLETERYITLPEGSRSGPMGESVLDLPPSEWAGIRNPDHYWIDGAGFMRFQANIRFYCPRGIRLSGYSNDYGEASTRYLA